MPSRLWTRWKRIAHRAAEIQSLVILAVLYWVVVVPIGLLRKRQPATAPPHWIVREAQPTVTLEDARRQG
jgi:hypothetical protein